MRLAVKPRLTGPVRFSILEAICEVLDCQPGDLLEFKETAGP